MLLLGAFDKAAEARVATWPEPRAWSADFFTHFLRLCSVHSVRVHFALVLIIHQCQPLSPFYEVTHTLFFLMVAKHIEHEISHLNHF